MVEELAEGCQNAGSERIKTNSETNARGRGQRRRGGEGEAERRSKRVSAFSRR
jgi:hypothetical protein